MSTTKKLRLGPLPKTESTKLTFVCPTSLKVDLDRYAALHAQAYGEAVDAATLIPHMLEAFMAGDRGFRKGTATRSTPPNSTASIERAAQAARSSFWMPPSLLGYDDATGPPFLGNPALHSAMRLSLPTLLCRS